jgi:hypothetical protein
MRVAEKLDWKGLMLYKKIIADFSGIRKQTEAKCANLMLC